MVGKVRQHNEFLPPLAFFSQQAAEFRDPELFSEVISSRALNSLDYRPLGRGHPFRCTNAAFNSPKLRLVAGSSTGTAFSASAGSNPWLLVPFYGQTRTIMDGRTFDWDQGQNAFSAPRDRMVGTSGARSIVGIEITPEHLMDVARSMLPDVAFGRLEAAIAMAEPRSVDLHVGRVKFEVVLQQYMSMIDSFGNDPAGIVKAGIEDMIIRSVVMMLAPQFFLNEANRPHKPSNLSTVCDYIEANLDQKLSLTVLENVSGLSSRALQYAFSAEFGMTPTQWVRVRRLEAVRIKLLNARTGDNVTAIASEYFANLGEFSQAYRYRFGELPSQTLSASLRKPLRN